jgi:hypothetical protein
MNNPTRDTLTKLQAQLEDIKSQVETIAEAEQEKFDNLSEGLQNSEKGETIQQAAESGTEVVDELTAASESLDNAIAKIDDMKQ